MAKIFTYDPCSQEFNDIDEEIVDYIQGIMLLKIDMNIDMEIHLQVGNIYIYQRVY